MSTTETEAIPQATTATCDACGQNGVRAGMTFDGTSWLCGNELVARETGNLQQFIDDVAACTRRQIAAAARAAEQEAAQQAAEPAQETPAEQDAGTGPAEPQPAAEDAPETVTDAEVNT